MSTHHGQSDEYVINTDGLDIRPARDMPNGAR